MTTGTDVLLGASEAPIAEPARRRRWWRWAVVGIALALAVLLPATYGYVAEHPSLDTGFLGNQGSGFTEHQPGFGAPDVLVLEHGDRGVAATSVFNNGRFPVTLLGVPTAEGFEVIQSVQFALVDRTGASPSLSPRHDTLVLPPGRSAEVWFTVIRSTCVSWSKGSSYGTDVLKLRVQHLGLRSNATIPLIEPVWVSYSTGQHGTGHCT